MYPTELHSLVRMQRIHQFYVRWGTLPLMALLFLAIMASLLLDRYGWSNVANRMVYGGLAIGVAGALYYFVNLWQLRNWRCPRCATRWPGWTEKAALCSGCGLRLPCSDDSLS